MNRAPIHIIAGSALFLGFAVPVWAADEAENEAAAAGADQAVATGNDLTSAPTNVEITELAGIRFVPESNPEKAGAVDQRAGGKSSGFLYFREAPGFEERGRDVVLSLGTDRDAPFTPRFRAAAPGAAGGIEGFLNPGEAWLLSSFTPRYANAHVSLIYGGKDEDSARKALGIALSSSVRVRPVDMPGVAVSPSLAEAFTRQQYNLGLNIGYQGFNLGASLRSEMGEFSDGYKGYDVGLSYRGSSWSTSLSVGEYSRRYSHIFSDTEDLENTYYAFELGASYSLSRAFSLSGGFRHFEYNRNNLLDTEGAPRSQIFYLGTRLRF